MVTGNSMGAVASFVANGVDDRIQGILPVSASGDLASGAAAGLMDGPAAAPGDRPSARRSEGDRVLLGPGSGQLRGAPARGCVHAGRAPRTSSFPCPQLLTTFRRVRAPAKSLAVVADYDHQWYFGTGCTARCMPGCPVAPTNRSRRRQAARRARTAAPKQCPPGQRWPYCGPHASYNDRTRRWPAGACCCGRWSPSTPAIRPEPSARPHRPRASSARATTSWCTCRGRPQPRAVRLAISDNGGFTYGQVLSPAATRRPRPAAYRHHHPGLNKQAILFAEVEAADGTVATSLPDLPRGFRPIVRPFESLATN